MSPNPLPPNLSSLSPYPATWSILKLLHVFFLFLTEAPGQDFVTLDYRLRYYPNITYAVIGSAVIFVLVVALLALVLHHQRKRSVLLPRGVRGSSHHHHHHQPLLLSRLVILDRGHMQSRSSDPPPTSPTLAGQYSSSPQAMQLLSGALYTSTPSMDSPPSYSEAVMDVRWDEQSFLSLTFIFQLLHVSLGMFECWSFFDVNIVFVLSRPPWFDLPPPPYLPDGDPPSEGELPQYDGLQGCPSPQAAHLSAPSTPRTVASGTRPDLSPKDESEL